MQFKQNSLALFYGYAGLVVIGAAGLATFILGESGPAVWITLALAMATVAAGNCYMGANRITINEAEILCSNRRGVCWRYQRSQILELKMGTVLRSRAIIIVPKEGSSEAAKLYFQLGRKAKQAIAHYGINVKKSGIL